VKPAVTAIIPTIPPALELASSTTPSVSKALTIISTESTPADSTVPTPTVSTSFTSISSLSAPSDPLEVTPTAREARSKPRYSKVYRTVFKARTVSTDDEDEILKETEGVISTYSSIIQDPVLQAELNSEDAAQVRDSLTTEEVPILALPKGDDELIDDDTLVIAEPEENDTQMDVS